MSVELRPHSPPGTYIVFPLPLLRYSEVTVEKVYTCQQKNGTVLGTFVSYLKKRNKNVWHWKKLANNIRTKMLECKVFDCRGSHSFTLQINVNIFCANTSINGWKEIHGGEVKSVSRAAFSPKMRWSLGVANISRHFADARDSFGTVARHHSFRFSPL